MVIDSPSIYVAHLSNEGLLYLPMPGFRPAELDAQIKAIPGGRWSSERNQWEWGWAPVAAWRLMDLGIQIDGRIQGLLLYRADRKPNEPTPVVADMFTMNLHWRATTRPRPHQENFKVWRRGGGMDGMLHMGALLEAGKGLGKTLSAIEEMLEQLHHKRDALILVLARNSNLHDPWATQLQLHGGFVPTGIDGDRHYMILDGPRKQRLACLPGPLPVEWRCQVYVHNHEDLPAMGKALRAQPWDMIVLDESSRMRTANAKRTKLLTGQFNLDAPNKIALSGAPMIKRVSDLYPTLKWLGAPTGNKAEFQERYVMLGGYTGVEEIAIKDVDGLNQLLDCYRFVVPKGSVQNLPRAWHRHQIELKSWQKESYKRIQKDLRTQWIAPDGKVEDRRIANRLGELLRLAQVTAGFEAIDTEHFNWRDDNAKAEVLFRDVLPDYGSDQVMVWAHFQPEIANLCRMANERGIRAGTYYGGQSQAANDEALSDFKGGEMQVLFLNTAKGGAGLNMPNAHTAIYYTRTFSTEDWEQSLDRNDRLDTVLEAGEVLNVDILEAPGTVDERIDMILGDDVRRAAQVTSVDVRAILGVAQ